jgi:hypothetical protein
MIKVSDDYEVERLCLLLMTSRYVLVMLMGR